MIVVGWHGMVAMAHGEKAPSNVECDREKNSFAIGKNLVIEVIRSASTSADLCTSFSNQK